jgi:hypothetical protein
MQKFSAEEINQTLDRVVRSAMPRLHKGIAAEVQDISDHVESPIELMLAAALEAMASVAWGGGRSSLAIIAAKHFRKIEPRPGEFGYWAVAQYQFDQMRVDFMLVSMHDLSPVLAIECDGHEFHERTKAQARRDRARDRAVQHQGVTIFRFTGSEIYADPCGCVEDVFAFLDR